MLTVGGRRFDYDRVDTYTGFEDAVANGPDTIDDVSESGVPIANLTFELNEDTLIYAQWSEGFRLGRGQRLPLDLCDVDNNGELDFNTGGNLTTVIEPDTTENIELGLKLSLLDKRLTINTAIFQTDWDNLPAVILPDVPEGSLCNQGIVNNIGSARSEGIELEVSYHMDAWMLDLAASYIEAEWTNVQSPILAGDTLSYVPRTNANLGLQYNLTIGEYAPFVRTDIAYVGEYESLDRSQPFATGGDYILVGLRVGVDLEKWQIALYGDNLLNEDTLLFHINGIGENSLGNRLSPRKVGLELSYNF